MTLDEIKDKYVLDKNGVTGNERRPVTYWATNERQGHRGIFRRKANTSVTTNL